MIDRVKTNTPLPARARKPSFLQIFCCEFFSLLLSLFFLFGSYSYQAHYDFEQPASRRLVNYPLERILANLGSNLTGLSHIAWSQTKRKKSCEKVFPETRYKRWAEEEWAVLTYSDLKTIFRKKLKNLNFSWKKSGRNKNIARIAKLP